MRDNPGRRHRKNALGQGINHWKTSRWENKGIPIKERSLGWVKGDLSMYCLPMSHAKCLISIKLSANFFHIIGAFTDPCRFTECQLRITKGSGPNKYKLNSQFHSRVSAQLWTGHIQSSSLNADIYEWKDNNTYLVKYLRPSDIAMILFKYLKCPLVNSRHLITTISHHWKLKSINFQVAKSLWLKTRYIQFRVLSFGDQKPLLIIIIQL